MNKNPEVIIPSQSWKPASIRGRDIESELSSEFKQGERMGYFHAVMRTGIAEKQFSSFVEFWNRANRNGPAADVLKRHWFAYTYGDGKIPITNVVQDFVDVDLEEIEQRVAAFELANGFIHPSYRPWDFKLEGVETYRVTHGRDQNIR